ncbi:MAG: type I DNA topoisomerase [Psychrobacter sp.]|nr:type I DNA topoisomerase [Psychrobacter sp.]
MSKENILIVESKGKVEHLQEILGPTWFIKPSGGHIRDMPQRELGVNTETLEIEYEISARGARFIKEITPLIANAKRIVLATDPDREGEAIADHLRTCLNLKIGDYQRCAFDEITHEGVLKAINNPREIDEDLVTAQTFRRIIDRLVGFTSTRALQIKTGIWSVVGRVQTPALWLIVTRDREIESFTSQTHYSTRLKTKDSWSCLLNTKLSNLENENGYWLDKEKAQQVADKIKSVKVIKSDETKSVAAPPNAFKTTTMQKAGINMLGVSGKEVMDLAGVLYNEGLITYIRTDDERMSDEGYKSLSDYVANLRSDLKLFGSKRSPKGKQAANAQEAHECIRPTDFSVDKLTVGGQLTQQHVDLYNMIHERALASQLEDAISKGVKLTLEGELDGKKYIFEASSSQIAYLGWKTLTAKDASLEEEEEEEEGKNGKIPLLSKGKLVEIESGSLVTRKTSPPISFNEVRLIDELERRGIGRPSTYQTIVGKIDTATGHSYVRSTTKNKKSILVSTPLGRQLIDSIEDSLGQGVLNIQYTQEMEDNLDIVSGGCENPNKFMFDFIKQLEIENNALTKNPLHPCGMPDCNSSMIRGKSKTTNNFYWRCIRKECGNIVGDDDGKPGLSFKAKKAMKVKEYSNADGTPKFPCPKCKSAIIGVEGKWGLFWPCSQVNDEKCDYTTKDDNGKPMSMQKVAELAAARKKSEDEAISISTTSDGKTPLWECSLCKSMVVKRKSKAGSWWFKCEGQDCNTRYWGDKDGNPKLDEPIDDSKKNKKNNKK